MRFDNVMGKPMVDRYEQVLFYSKAEYARRRDAVLQCMRRQAVPLLLIADPCEEGFAAWLANDVACQFLLLRDTGEITLVYGHSYGVRQDYTPHPERHAAQKPLESLVPGVRFQSGLDIAEIRDALGAEKRLGVINRQYLPAGFVHTLEAEVPGLEYCDLRVPVSMIRAVRSPEEQQALSCTAAAETALYNAAKALIRPGRYPRDIIHELSAIAHDMGCGRDDIAIFFLMSGLENDGSAYPRPLPMNNGLLPPLGRIEKGWKLQLMLEISHFGNMIIDTGRPFYIGTPHPMAQEVWEKLIRTQDYAAGILRPGITAVEFEAKTAAYARDTEGISLQTWNILHGMGNTRTEAPDFRDPTTNSLPLLDGMYLLCEPIAALPSPPGVQLQGPPLVMMLPNTFLVTPEGGRRVTTIPNEIVVI